METKVTLFELLISCGGVLTAIISAWIHAQIKTSKLETKLMYIEKEVREEKENVKANSTVISAQFKAMDDKFDMIFKAITDLKVAIAENMKK